MRAAVRVPSGFFSAVRKIAAPGFSRLGSPGDIGHDRRVGADHHLGFADLMGDLQHLAVRRRTDPRHRRIGHHAVRNEVPGLLTFGDAAHRLGEDVDLDRVQVAVRPFDRGRGDVVAGLDVGEAPLGDTLHGVVGGKHDCHLLAVARFYDQVLAVELFDRPPNPSAGSLGSALTLCLGRCRLCEEQADREGEHREFAHFGPPCLPQVCGESRRERTSHFGDSRRFAAGPKDPRPAHHGRRHVLRAA